MKGLSCMLSVVCRWVDNLLYIRVDIMHITRKCVYIHNR